MVFKMLLCGECYLKAYKLPVIQSDEWWIVCMSLSMKVALTLTIQ
jgi:hypothetical protein